MSVANAIGQAFRQNAAVIAANLSRDVTWPDMVWTAELGGVKVNWVKMRLEWRLNGPALWSLVLPAKATYTLNQTLFDAKLNGYLKMRGLVETEKPRTDSGGDTWELGSRDVWSKAYKVSHAAQSWAATIPETIFTDIMASTGLTKERVTNPWPVTAQKKWDTDTDFAAWTLNGAVISGTGVAAVIKSGETGLTVVQSVTFDTSCVAPVTSQPVTIPTANKKYRFLAYMVNPAGCGNVTSGAVTFNLGTTCNGGQDVGDTVVNVGIPSFTVIFDNVLLANTSQRWLTYKSGSLDWRIGPVGSTPVFQSPCGTNNTTGAAHEVDRYDFTSPQSPVSDVLTPANFISWKTVQVDGVILPAGSSATAEIRNSGNTTTLAGPFTLAAGANSFDISTITATSIRVRVNLSMTDLISGSPPSYDSVTINSLQNAYDFSTPVNENKGSEAERLAKQLAGEWFISDYYNQRWSAILVSLRGMKKAITFEDGVNCTLTENPADVVKFGNRVKGVAGTLTSTQDDTASQATYGVVEIPYKDQKITTQGALDAACKNLVAKYKDPWTTFTITNMSVTLMKDIFLNLNLQPGDTVTIKSSRKSINTTKRVMQLIADITNKGVAVTVTAGSLYAEVQDQALRIVDLQRMA